MHGRVRHKELYVAAKTSIRRLSFARTRLEDANVYTNDKFNREV